MILKEERGENKNAAYLAMLERHKGILYKVARSYSKRGETDDLIQEICLQIWKSFDKYDNNYAESTWVYRIALNTCISAYRKERKTEVVPIENLPLLQHTDPDHDGQLEEMYRLIQKLQEIDRALLVLHFDGNSHKEIAAIMGFTESNVSTRLSRIRNTLKSMIN